MSKVVFNISNNLRAFKWTSETRWQSFVVLVFLGIVPDHPVCWVAVKGRDSGKVSILWSGDVGLISFWTAAAGGQSRRAGRWGGGGEEARTLTCEMSKNLKMERIYAKGAFSCSTTCLAASRACTTQLQIKQLNKHEFIKEKCCAHIQVHHFTLGYYLKTCDHVSKQLLRNCTQPADRTLSQY